MQIAIGFVLGMLWTFLWGALATAVTPMFIIFAIPATLFIIALLITCKVSVNYV